MLWQEVGGGYGRQWCTKEVTESGSDRACWRNENSIHETCESIISVDCGLEKADAAEIAPDMTLEFKCREK